MIDSCQSDTFHIVLLTECGQGHLFILYFQPPHPRQRGLASYWSSYELRRLRVLGAGEMRDRLWPRGAARTRGPDSSRCTSTRQRRRKKGGGNRTACDFGGALLIEVCVGRRRRRGDRQLRGLLRCDVTVPGSGAVPRPSRLAATDSSGKTGSKINIREFPCGAPRQQHPARFNPDLVEPVQQSHADQPAQIKADS